MILEDTTYSYDLIDKRKSSVSFLCLRRVIGSWPWSWSSLYLFLRMHITLSMWMWTLATCFENSSSCKESCLLPWQKEGMTNVALWSATSLSMSKPLLTKMRSLSSKSFEKPLFTVIHLSVALPPQHFERNDILPDRNILNRNLIMLCRFVIWIWFCYSAWYDYGCSMNLSEQSIIQQALGYASLQIEGKFARQVSFDGHLMRKLRCWNITVIILWKESVAVVMAILKQCDKSSTRRSCLTLINVRSKPSDVDSFSYRPILSKKK